jgi:hypothetical protein
MKAQPENVAVYVVHLWTRQAPQGFRASVRRVDHDHAEFFSEAAALTQYFENHSTPELGDRSPLPGGTGTGSRGEE